VAGWYSPLITATIWHVFHPRGWVEYRGLHIRVPWPWIADTDLIGADPTVTPQGIALKKMPNEIVHRLPTQSLFVTVISPDPGLSAGQQTERWMDLFRASHPGAAFNPTPPMAIPRGASCLSARGYSQEGGIIWTCIFVEGGWVANFEGQDGDVPVFFQIVLELKR